MGDERDFYELLADGDPETVASQTDWPGVRRPDPVASWPSDRLGELIDARPDLLPELRQRRPSEVQQL